MSNHGNHYYNAMPFGLKNIGPIYQRLMDVVFAHKIGRNLEIYVYDMIVKTVKGHNHAKDLNNVLQ